MIHILQGDGLTKNVSLDGNSLSPSKSQEVINHSPDGFEWGYGGSGPAQLALAVLLELVDKDLAVSQYQDFKWDYISKLPKDRNFKVKFDLETDKDGMRISLWNY